MATIVRYDPFAVARPFGGLADRLFRDGSFMSRPWHGRAAAGSYPAASLYETAEGYELQVPLPGVPADDLEVSIHDDVVTIKGQRTVTVPEQATRLWRGVQSAISTLPGGCRARWTPTRCRRTWRTVYCASPYPRCSISVRTASQSRRRVSLLIPKPLSAMVERGVCWDRGWTARLLY